MKSLKEYIIKETECCDDEDSQINPLDYGELKERVDLALVGDIKIYSDSGDFFERKENIANAFKQKLSIAETTTDYISKTKIFNYYIIHLVDSYKKNIDEDIVLNVSSENELRHQIATDIVLLIKNQE